MRRLTYGLRLTGRMVEADVPGVLRAEARAPAPSPVFVSRDAPAELEAEVVMTGRTSFVATGSLGFADGDRLSVRTVGSGHLAPGPRRALRHGATTWSVVGGTGRFARARGLIASTFLIEPDGALLDLQAGILFLAGSPRPPPRAPHARRRGPLRPPETRRRRRKTVSLDANKALVRRLFDDDISRGDLAAADDIIHPDFVDHTNPPQWRHGIAGHKAIVALFRSVFPDLTWRADALIAEEDLVAARTTMTGTQRGDFFGVPPTGRRVTVSGVHVLRVQDGKLVEHWGNNDDLGLLRQLGALPDPA